MIQRISTLLLATILIGCASNNNGAAQDLSQPSNPHNLCSILHEKKSWDGALQRVKEKYSVAPYVVMSIMYQGSSFKYNARPVAKSGRGLWGTSFASTAYGFSQALDLTWAEYKKSSGHADATRDSFSDSAHFIGWYMNRTRVENKVSMSDAKSHYLAYHEGWGGYRRGTYKKKKWLMSTAVDVQQRASRYKVQLNSCSSSSSGDGFFRRNFL